MVIYAYIILTLNKGKRLSCKRGCDADEVILQHTEKTLFTNMVYNEPKLMLKFYLGL